MSPATNTDFEIHISNMIGIGNHQNTYTVVDEIKKNKQIPTLIIFGDGENTKVPELLNGTSVKIIKIPGDHHYKVVFMERAIQEIKYTQWRRKKNR